MRLPSFVVAGAIVALGSLGSAQASYTTYGNGCRGSGSGCASANASGTTLGKFSVQNQTTVCFGVPAQVGVNLSDKYAGTIKLPFDLTILNANGCWLLSSLDWQFQMTSGPGGKARMQFSVPNNAILKGVDFYNQYVVDDPSVNGYGLVTTNGGKGTAG